MGLFDFNKKKEADNDVQTKTAFDLSKETGREVIDLKFKKLHPNAKLPKYANDGDSCLDIKSVDCEFNHEYQAYVYSTGLAVEVPKGYVLNIYPRSSNIKTEAYIPNSVGKIDSNYRGELFIVFKNRHVGNFTQPHAVGDRLAQIELMPIPLINPVFVDELSETNRGEKGFGSTGK